MISIAAAANLIAQRAYAPGVVAAKELTQLANRRRFHLEKALFAAAVSGIFVLTVCDIPHRPAMSLHDVAKLGRQAFLSMCALANVVLSLTALGTATGIIMSEVQGRRLDILRATPLSLAGMIAGKAFAITAKSALSLTLLLPVMGAAYLEGGVGADEIAKLFALIVSSVVLLTCMGLRVSATAKTMVDRVARPIAYLLAWSFFSGIVAAVLSVIPGIRRMAPWAAVSWIGAWGLSTMAQFSWKAVLLNGAVHASAGALFLWSAVGALRRTIVALDETPHQRKVKAFFITMPAWFGRRRARYGRSVVRAISALSARAGGLVGGQILRTSLLSIAAPLGLVCLVITGCVLINALIDTEGARRSEFEAYFFLACLSSAFVAAAVCAEACGLIAREKSGHTAEILATTPAGGPAMIRWKGAALFITQALAIAACMAFLSATGCIFERANAAAVFIVACGFAASLVLAFALGVSFSLAVRTTEVAGGLAGLTLAVLTPIMTYAVIPAMLGALGWRIDISSLTYRSADMGLFILPIVALLAIGSALVLLRNLVPILSAAILCASVSTILAAGAYLCVSPGGGGPIYVPAAPVTVLGEAGGLPIAFVAIVLQLVLAGLLLVGARINFDALFLRHARRAK